MDFALASSQCAIVSISIFFVPCELPIHSQEAQASIEEDRDFRVDAPAENGSYFTCSYHDLCLHCV